MPYTQQLNDKSAYRAALLHRRRIRPDDLRPFDVLYREGAESGRVMAIALHPYLIGVPHRIGAFDKALKYICRHAEACGERLARKSRATIVAQHSGALIG